MWSLCQQVDGRGETGGLLWLSQTQEVRNKRWGKRALLMASQAYNALADSILDQVSFVADVQLSH